jgi:hypothetical protein
MNEKSFELFQKEHAATEKFDYFMTTVAGALFAYIGQHYQPQKFDSPFSFILPAALICLTLSFVCGLLVIKFTIAVTGLNKEFQAAKESCEHIHEKIHSLGLCFRLL